MIIIVTGTNTDVGKTIATAALACQYRDAGYGVEVVKPAQTGDDSDIRDIEKLSGVAGREYTHYPEPLAPNIAARRAGMPQLELHATAERIRHLDADDTVVLVEGAGGLLVRMADTWTLADLAVELAAPLIVVTSTGLGSLNLAELTVMAARARGITVLGLIGGSLPTNPDLATRLNLTEFPVVTGVPLLGCLPENCGDCPPEHFKLIAQQITLPRSGQ